MTRRRYRSTGAMCIALLLHLSLIAQTPAGAAATSSDMQGPLADFWAKVKRDWSLRLDGLNRGPLQTAIWVALVWDGPDALRIDQLVRDLQDREARRWVRAQITDHRWSSIRDKQHEKMLALRQNIILLGTPDQNPLVERALRQTPIRIEPGSLWVKSPVLDARGRTSVESRYHSGDLLVITIAPNPVHPEFYALVITGTSPDVLPEATQIPYGDSDYVIYRGHRLVEQGYFEWRDGRPGRGRVDRSLPFSEHFEWRTYVMGRFRLHYDPHASPAGGIARLGRRLEGELERLAGFYHIDARDAAPIDCYLYASLDEKVNQTGDSSPAHIHRASGIIHALHGPDPEAQGSMLTALVATVLLRRSPEWGPGGELEMPGFALALALAGTDHFDTIPLAQWAQRSKRDRGWMPIDILFVRRPERLDGTDLAPLETAAFVRDLLDRAGPEKVALFYRTSDRSDFHRRYREIFGLRIGEEEDTWIAGLMPPGGQTVAVRSRGSSRGSTTGENREAGAVAGAGLPDGAHEAFMRRDHPAAERLMAGLDPTPESMTLTARIRFREGRFDEAIRVAGAALAAPGGTADDRAWARVTAGRSHAAGGRIMAATLELQSDDIAGGPRIVRVLADYWLEKLGQPLNRRAAHRILMQEADTALMNFDWEGAEERLLAVLAADPANREAHATLGEVYLSKYQYWYDWLLLDKELFPAESMADPETYRFLADKGRRELDMAGQLPFGEEDRWLSETGPVDPGSDQPAPHFLLGRVHFLRGNYDAARREFEAALTLERGRTSLAAYCHLFLGRIAAARGEVAEARSQFESAVAIGATGNVTPLAKEALRHLPGNGP